MEYVVYGKVGCSFCDKAKALLDQKGIDFTYVDIGEDSAALEMIKSRGCRTVPQIVVNGDWIGGFTELYEML